MNEKIEPPEKIFIVATDDGDYLNTEWTGRLAPGKSEYVPAARLAKAEAEGLKESLLVLARAVELQKKLFRGQSQYSDWETYLDEALAAVKARGHWPLD